MSVVNGSALDVMSDHMHKFPPALWGALREAMDAAYDAGVAAMAELEASAKPSPVLGWSYSTANGPVPATRAPQCPHNGDCQLSTAECARFERIKDLRASVQSWSGCTLQFHKDDIEELARLEAEHARRFDR